MAELTLPRLVGSRKAARTLVEHAAAGSDLRGAILVVDCRELRSAPPSFADEMVEVALVDHGAASIMLKDASAEFEGYVRTAAAAHHLDARVIDAIRGVERG